MNGLPTYSFEPRGDGRLSLRIEGRKTALACRLERSEKLGTTCFLTWLRPDAYGRVHVTLADGRRFPLSRIIAITSEGTAVQQRCEDPRCANPDHLVLSHEKTPTEERLERLELWPEGPEKALERLEQQIALLEEERQLILAELGRSEVPSLDLLRIKLGRIAQRIKQSSTTKEIRLRG